MTDTSTQLENLASELRRADEIKSKNDEAQRQLAETEQQLSNAQNDLALLKAEVDRVKTEKASIDESHLKAMNLYHDQLAEQNLKLDKVKGEIEAFYTENGEKLKELDRKHKTLEIQLAKLDTATKDNEASANEKRVATTEAKNALEALKVERLQYDAAKKGAEQALQDQSSKKIEITNLQETLEAKDKELSLLKNQLEAKAIDLDQREARIRISESKNREEETNLDQKRIIDRENTRVLIQFLEEAKLKGFQEEKLARREAIKAIAENTAEEVEPEEKKTVKPKKKAKK